MLGAITVRSQTVNSKDTNLSCQECGGISLLNVITSPPSSHLRWLNLTITPVCLLFICSGCLWLLERRMDLATSNGWSHTTFHSENFSVRNSRSMPWSEWLSVYIRQSYLRLCQTFANVSFAMIALNFASGFFFTFFMRVYDGNLSQIINGVCCPADSITKPDHFWGIKFPKLLPKLFLTSPNWLDTIFIISKNLLNKNWMAC